ncbi:MAG TPA: hypothetical protein VM260_19690, partial [Pirellula sp.]|nr:hypothetical protein [Pirellula sp.]
SACGLATKTMAYLGSFDQQVSYFCSRSRKTSEQTRSILNSCESSYDSCFSNRPYSEKNK